MSNDVFVSHFPLKPVALHRSRCRHSKPAAYAGWLRSRGFFALVVRDRVEVLHGPEEPDPTRKPEARRAAGPEDASRALESHLRSRVSAAGYLRLGSRYVAPAPLHTLESRAGSAAIRVHEHRAWRWELHGAPPCWLAPLPSRACLSAAPPDTPPWSEWLAGRERSVTALILFVVRSANRNR